MIQRKITLPNDYSFFLFGARGTGKTYLLQEKFTQKNSLYLDLLLPETFNELILQPEILQFKIDALPENIEWVVIDEVQKIPVLLDIVHRRIEEGNRGEKRKIQFALTGSSARKLKRGGANLLAGRALVYNLFPLTSIELGDNFHLVDALSYGTLPLVHQNPKRRSAILQAYTHTYLKEEIQQEQLLRGLDPFIRFLPIAAQMDGNVINFSSIASDCGADNKSVQKYFKILEDTYLGILLEPFSYSIRKRQAKNPKFYFFDCGVQRALAQTLGGELKPKSYDFGIAFESFVINEINRLQHYGEKYYRLSFLRTKDDAEIDLILERPNLPTALIEIKSTNLVTEKHVLTLQKFAKDFQNCEPFCLSLDPNAKKIGNVSALHWQKGLQELGVV